MPGYFISGLSVSSDIELPGAISRIAAEEPAVSIRPGRVPEELNGATATGPTWAIAGEVFLLRVPRVGRFLISAGREIIVEFEPGVQERDGSVFILGTAFGILLHQRGAVVLHGAAVARNGRAIAICGRSGAGKSTLAAALCGRGCAFAADDICVIGLDAQRRPNILPDGRQLKLWGEAIDKLDLADRRGDAVRDGKKKYFVAPVDAVQVPPTLSAIYILREAQRPRNQSIERLALPDALRTLDREAYRPGFRARIGQSSIMLAQSAAVLSHADAFNLFHPRGFEHLEETATSLLDHWDSLDE